MTDLQYGIIALVVLAVAMNFHRLAAMAKGQGQPAATPPAAPTSQPPPAPHPGVVATHALAELLNQQITAEAQTRAVTRSVEAMIEGRSQQVQLTWAGPAQAPAGPGGTPVPNP